MVIARGALTSSFTYLTSRILYVSLTSITTLSPMLPVLKKDGSIELLPWGRRQKQPGFLPVTGWAKIESIYGGVWERYFPKPVKDSSIKLYGKRF
jgi:hypothetical protein